MIFFINLKTLIYFLKPPKGCLSVAQAHIESSRRKYVTLLFSGSSDDELKSFAVDRSKVFFVSNGLHN